jgi:hypothetical protein
MRRALRGPEQCLALTCELKLIMYISGQSIDAKSSNYCNSLIESIISNNNSLLTPLTPAIIVD